MMMKIFTKKMKQGDLIGVLKRLITNIYQVFGYLQLEQTEITIVLYGLHIQKYKILHKY